MSSFSHQSVGILFKKVGKYLGSSVKTHEESKGLVGGGVIFIYA